MKLRRVGDSKEKPLTVHVNFIQPLRTDRKRLLITTDIHLLEGLSTEERDADDDEGVAFKVEAVRGMRDRGGRLELLVHWRGYSDSSDEWLCEDRLDCAALIDEFLAASGTEKLVQL